MLGLWQMEKVMTFVGGELNRSPQRQCQDSENKRCARARADLASDSEQNDLIL